MPSGARFPARSWAALGLIMTLTAPALAQQSFACRQLGAVADTPRPVWQGATADVQLVVGDHYWACPCGESRHLVGDNEHRALVGDNEHRALVGDNEHRALVGDNEHRALVGDNEHRALVGDNEHRALVGDNEHRTLVGDAGGLQCRKDPGCGGFALLGASTGSVQVVARDGMRQEATSCIIAY